jgi:hypothetical protein
MTTTAASAEELTRIFRDEHRQVRDALLDLIAAFERRDREAARSLLGRVAALTGPHFRYEEEALYPALVDLFGGDYVEQLWRDHHRAIGGAKRLVELVEKDHLGDEDVREAVGIVRSILPHVSDCDGLSIMVEVLPPGTAERILAQRERSLGEGLDLIAWAEGVRGRPALSPGS